MTSVISSLYKNISQKHCCSSAVIGNRISWGLKPIWKAFRGVRVPFLFYTGYKNFNYEVIILAFQASRFSAKIRIQQIRVSTNGGVSRCVSMLTCGTWGHDNFSRTNELQRWLRENSCN